MNQKKIQKYLVGIISFLVLGYTFLLLSFSENDLISPGSLQVYSSEGILIRENLSKNEVYSKWVKLEKYPKELTSLVLLSEDKRFFFHPGFDLVSMFRSLLQNINNGRIISGASTIPQQLTRILWKEKMPKNKGLRKIVEIFYSISITIRFSKDQILESYLNNVPFTGQIVGFSNASKYILGKDLELLSKEEMIYLVVLLRNPNARERRVKDRFLRFAEEYCPGECRVDSILQSTIWEEYNKNKYKSKSSSLHFHDWVNSLVGKEGEVQTFFSENINFHINKILQNELQSLSEYNAEQGAIIILKIDKNAKRKLKLISFIGSREYSNALEGQVKGNLALRNAGSTLKPFVYGLGMEKLDWAPETIFQDEDKSFRTSGGSHRPKNNDRKYWGRITLREALGTSRNLTAIQAIEKIGVERFYEFLKTSGLTHLTEPFESYGTGLALGVGEISLLQLTHLYSALAMNGEMEPISIGNFLDQEINYGQKRRIFSEKTSCLLTHILSDKGIRKRAFGKRSFLDFPYDVAVKTGTSKDYRDSWTVGYTNKYVVGVWVGNFSGSPMKRISGSFGAGRVFQQIVRYLHSSEKTTFPCFSNYMRVSLCRISGDLAEKTCPYYTEISRETKKREKCKIVHLKGEEYSYNEKLEVLSPTEGEIYKIDSDFPKAIQQVPLRILAPEGVSFTYQIDQKPPVGFTGNIETFLQLDTGFHVLKVFNREEEVQEIRFVIKK